MARDKTPGTYRPTRAQSRYAELMSIHTPLRDPFSPAPKAAPRKAATGKKLMSKITPVGFDYKVISTRKAKP